MIFYNKTTDNEENIILIKTYLDEDSIIIYDESYGVLNEKSYSVKDIGFKKIKGNDYRYVLIDSSKSGHSSRMKVSLFGERINPNTSHNSYISMFYDDGDVKYEGDIKNIKMTTKELNLYKDLYMRNKNLIDLVQYYPNPQYCNDAFINDEKLRNQGNIVERDKDGNANVYDKDKNLLYRLNIKGEKI